MKSQPSGRPAVLLATLVAGAAALHGQEASPPATAPAGEAAAVAPDAPLRDVLEELARTPTENAAREARLVELFKAASATTAAAIELPKAQLEPRLEEAKRELRERLTARKLKPGAIDAAIRELESAHGRIGRNVFATLAGKSKRIVAFGAHYDTVAGSAGVIDNWAACTLLVDLCRRLQPLAREHTFWFLGFAGQEDGAIGSIVWVDSLTPAQVNLIDAFVTVDCAGIAAPTVWWSGSHPPAVEFAVDAAARSGRLLRVVDFPGGGSDAASMRSRWIPTVSLLGIDPAGMELLHGPGDVASAIQPDRLAEMAVVLDVIARDFDQHQQPLRWDYAKAKLRIGDPESGRTALVPTRIQLPGAHGAEPRKDGSLP